jgi:hypothetical protein
LGNDAQAGVSTSLQVIVGIENFHYVLKECMHGRKKVYVFLYPDPFFGKSNNTKIMIPLVNRAINIGCYGSDVEFVNLKEILDKSCFDGKDIHPTRHGHELIANYMKKIGAI